MLNISRFALRWYAPALALILCVSLLAPSSGLAQESRVTSGSAVTTAPLNMRAGPSLADSVVAVIPSGTSVGVTGAGQSGFLPVSWNGTSGWASADYLSQSAPADTGEVSETGTAQTVAPLNFRSGPGTTYGVISVIPGGASVSLTGESSNGFVSVAYNGYEGWVSADYVTTGSSNPSPEPEPAPSIGTATVTTGLHLRSGPGTSNASLTIMPAGASVSVTGATENGFLPVTYNGLAGWASAQFLNTGVATSAPQEPAPAPGSGGSGIIWPVSGGTWSIIQGYNGGTHQNRSASAQYYYALDIARTDGNTAGQAVYAPASGTILWLDPGSGGIAIDMGNGYVVAMFHSTFDGGLSRGQWVDQGQYLGTVSGPGGPGYASTPHVDMTLWQSGGGGSRSAAPFTGSNAVSGMDLPDVGGWNQHGGTTFNP